MSCAESSRSGTIRRLLCLLSSDAHCHHKRAADSLANAVCTLTRIEERMGVLATLLSPHFLFHPRWETRTASALAFERALSQDRELCLCFYNTACALSPEAASPPLALLSDNEQQQLQLLRLDEFDFLRTIGQGQLLRSMSDEQSKYLYENPLERLVAAAADAAAAAAAATEAAMEAEAAPPLTSFESSASTSLEATASRASSCAAAACAAAAALEKAARAAAREAQRELRRRIGFETAAAGPSASSSSSSSSSGSGMRREEAEIVDRELVRAGLSHLDCAEANQSRNNRPLAQRPHDDEGDQHLEKGTAQGGDAPFIGTEDVLCYGDSGGAGSETRDALGGPVFGKKGVRATTTAAPTAAPTVTSVARTAKVEQEKSNNHAAPAKGEGDEGETSRKSSCSGSLVGQTAAIAPPPQAPLTSEKVAAGLKALQCNVLDPTWYRRHGAALGLVSLLRALRLLLSSEDKAPSSSSSSISLSSSSATTAEPFSFFAKKSLNPFLEDVSTRCLVVLSLDRFADYSGLQVVAPVRETAAQALALAAAAFNGSSSSCFGSGNNDHGQHQDADAGERRFEKVTRCLLGMVKTDNSKQETPSLFLSSAVAVSMSNEHTCREILPSFWEPRHGAFLCLSYLVAIRGVTAWSSSTRAFVSSSHEKSSLSPSPSSAKSSVCNDRGDSCATVSDLCSAALENLRPLKEAYKASVPAHKNAEGGAPSTLFHVIESSEPQTRAAAEAATDTRVAAAKHVSVEELAVVRSAACRLLRALLPCMSSEETSTVLDAMASLLLEQQSGGGHDGFLRDRENTLNHAVDQNPTTTTLHSGSGGKKKWEIPQLKHSQIGDSSSSCEESGEISGGGEEAALDLVGLLAAILEHRAGAVLLANTEIAAPAPAPEGGGREKQSIKGSLLGVPAGGDSAAVLNCSRVACLVKALKPHRTMTTTSTTTTHGSEDVRCAADQAECSTNDFSIVDTPTFFLPPSPIAPLLAAQAAKATSGILATQSWLTECAAQCSSSCSHANYYQHGGEGEEDEGEKGHVAQSLCSEMGRMLAHLAIESVQMLLFGRCPLGSMEAKAVRDLLSITVQRLHDLHHIISEEEATFFSFRSGEQRSESRAGAEFERNTSFRNDKSAFDMTWKFCLGILLFESNPPTQEQPNPQHKPQEEGGHGCSNNNSTGYLREEKKKAFSDQQHKGVDSLMEGIKFPSVHPTAIPSFSARTATIEAVVTAFHAAAVNFVNSRHKKTRRGLPMSATSGSGEKDGGTHPHSSLLPTPLSCSCRCLQRCERELVERLLNVRVGTKNRQTTEHQQTLVVWGAAMEGAGLVAAEWAATVTQEAGTTKGVGEGSGTAEPLLSVTSSNTPPSLFSSVSDAMFHLVSSDHDASSQAAISLSTTSSSSAPPSGSAAVAAVAAPGFGGGGAESVQFEETTFLRQQLVGVMSGLEAAVHSSNLLHDDSQSAKGQKRSRPCRSSPTANSAVASGPAWLRDVINAGDNVNEEGNGVNNDNGGVAAVVIATHESGSGGGVGETPSFSVGRRESNARRKRVTRTKRKAEELVEETQGASAAAVKSAAAAEEESAAAAVSGRSSSLAPPAPLEINPATSAAARQKKRPRHPTDNLTRDDILALSHVLDAEVDALNQFLDGGKAIATPLMEKWRRIVSTAPPGIMTPVRNWHAKVRFTEKELCREHRTWQRRREASCVAAAAIVGAKAPIKFANPIRTLMACLKEEPDELRRQWAAVAVAELVHLLTADPGRRCHHPAATLLLPPASRPPPSPQQPSGLNFSKWATEAAAVDELVNKAAEMPALSSPPSSLPAMTDSAGQNQQQKQRQKWAATANKVLGNLCNFVGVADSADAPHRRAGAAAALREIVRRCDSRSRGGGNTGNTKPPPSFLTRAFQSLGHLPCLLQNPIASTQVAPLSSASTPASQVLSQLLPAPPPPQTMTTTTSVLLRHPLLFDRMTAPLIRFTSRPTNTDTATAKDNEREEERLQELETALHLILVLAPLLNNHAAVEEVDVFGVEGGAGGDTEGEGGSRQTVNTPPSSSSASSSASFSDFSRLDCAVGRIVVVLSLESPSPLIRNLATDVAATLLQCCNDDDDDSGNGDELTGVHDSSSRQRRDNDDGGNDSETARGSGGTGGGDLRGGDLQGGVARHLGPLLLAALNDGCGNDERRHAAVVLLARCVSFLGTAAAAAAVVVGSGGRAGATAGASASAAAANPARQERRVSVVRHLRSLLPPAVSAVNDPTDRTRRLAYKVFSTLVQLVPLASDHDLRFLRTQGERQTAGNEERQLGVRETSGGSRGSVGSFGVLAHLVLGAPLPLQFSRQDEAKCLQPHVSLREYQRDGVSWLLFLFRAGMHGALCDDMGLGKTLQVLAAVALFWQSLEYEEGREQGSVLLPVGEPLGGTFAAASSSSDSSSSSSDSSSSPREHGPLRRRLSPKNKVGVNEAENKSTRSKLARPRLCLVVCPATLVGHWASEAIAFLKPHVFSHSPCASATPTSAPAPERAPEPASEPASAKYGEEGSASAVGTAGSRTGSSRGGCGGGGGGGGSDGGGILQLVGTRKQRNKLLSQFLQRLQREEEEEEEEEEGGGREREEGHHGNIGKATVDGSPSSSSGASSALSPPASLVHTSRNRRRPHVLVVTSYNTLRQDCAELAGVAWDVCVLDEAHVLSNTRTKLFQAVKQLKAKHRICLTGTPIQNDVEDLWAAFEFLMPGFLDEKRAFRQKFHQSHERASTSSSSSSASSSGGGRSGGGVTFIDPEQVLALEELHRRVLPFLLRREKHDVLAELPPKVIVDVPCPLSSQQATLYQRLVDNSAQAQQKERASSSAGRSDEGDSPGDAAVSSGAAVRGGGGGSGGGGGGFHSLQSLALVCTHPCLLNSAPCGLQSTSSTTEERLANDKEEFAKWRADDSASGKFLVLRDLLSQCGYEPTRMVTTNLATSAQSGLTKSPAAKLVLSKSTTRRFTSEACSEDSATDVDVDDDDDDDDEKENDEDEEDENGDDGEKKKKKKKKGAGTQDNTTTTTTTTRSTPGKKFLLFAQHRRCLDLVEELVLNKFFPALRFLRFDGSVEPQKRFELAKQFQSDPTVSGLLLTSRVGGLGLNLSSASVAFFLEHDWNPQVDLQAMDRAHRIGQKGCLTVYRLFAPDTVEERVLEVQARKVAVAKAVVNRENSSVLAMSTDHIFDLVGEQQKEQEQKEKTAKAVLNEKKSGDTADHDSAGLDTAARGAESSERDAEQVLDEQYRELDVGRFLEMLGR